MKKVLVAGEINVDLVLQGYAAFPVPGKETLVDDFVFSHTERALHVRNAPSPGATSALAIARVIADRLGV